ncbi:restriction endonuclease [Blautia sp.]|uniref:restriction endonuclease n=1 Tax=Blautia sp. TaxID=1955243 RepID=UPI003A902F41
MHKVTKLWNKLTKAAKITFVVWSVYLLINFAVSYNSLKLYQWIIIWLFGIFIFVFPALGISILAKRLRVKRTKQVSSSTVSQQHDILSSELLSDVIEEKTAVSEVSNSTPNFDCMEGHDFEYFCADILRQNGYINVDVTRGSGDQGIDILAEKDGIKYGIQCKCYSSDIGNKAVQEAFSGKTFYGCHVAVVLTNRHFTKSAKELADSNHVLLWDREKLESFISHCN